MKNGNGMSNSNTSENQIERTLYARLKAKAEEKGHCKGRLAEEMGCSLALIDILKANEDVSDFVDQELAEKCAKYLNLSTLEVKKLAGIIDTEDVYTCEKLINWSMRQIAHDTHVQSITRSEIKHVHSLSIAKKIIVLLSAEFSGHDFLCLQDKKFENKIHSH